MTAEEGSHLAQAFKTLDSNIFGVSMLPSVQGLLAGTTSLIGGFYCCARTMHPTLVFTLSALARWQTTAPLPSTDILRKEPDAG